MLRSTVWQCITILTWKRFDEAIKAADIFFNECEKADYSYLDYMYYGHLLESLKNMMMQ